MPPDLIFDGGLPDPGRLLADRAVAEAQATARRTGARGGDGDLSLGNDRDGLRQVAQQFEALFLNQLLKSMRATVPENEIWGQNTGTKIYRQMHDQALAERMAEAGRGLGIAQMIERQFADSVAGEDRASPPELPRSVAAYQRRLPEDGQAARLRGLRRLATDAGAAAADSLARYERHLTAAARETGVDPGLLLAVLVHESGGDSAAVSARGARGLMQLMPATAREVGVRDPHDPAQGIQGGARYLARMLERFPGRVDLALAAYNAGPGAVDRAGGRIPSYPETQNYVDRVWKLAIRLGMAAGSSAPQNSGTELATRPWTGSDP